MFISSTNINARIGGIMGFCEFELLDNGIKCKHCGFFLKNVKTINFRKQCTTNREYPSMFQMAKNAVTAAVAFVGNGFKVVDETEQARRLDICKGCDQYDKEQNRCYQCGCYLTFKTKIEGGGCPLNKW